MLLGAGINISGISEIRRHPDSRALAPTSSEGDPFLKTTFVGVCNGEDSPHKVV